MTTKISSKTAFMFIIILLSLIATLYNPSIANLFIVFTVGILGFIVLDRKRTILIEKNVNRTKSIMYGVGGWVASLVLTFLVLGFLYIFGVQAIGAEFSFQAGISSVFELLTQTQQTLAFAGSTFFEFLAFGIAIPIIETLFFCLVAYELFYEIGKAVGQDVRFNIPLNKINLPTIITFLIISYGVVFYHLSSKGVVNTPALISVFIFFFISLIVVMLEGQALGAVLMHIINNSVAVFLALGIVFATPWIIGGVVALVLYLIITRFKFKLEV